MKSVAKVETMRWIGDVDGQLVLIDQTLLPVEFRELTCGSVESVWEAIKMLRVRGAPAIGIAAAYGVCVGLQPYAAADHDSFFDRLEEVIQYLASSRPTAVNLFWALERMRNRAESLRAAASIREVASHCSSKPVRSTKKTGGCVMRLAASALNS